MEKQDGQIMSNYFIEHEKFEKLFKLVKDAVLVLDDQWRVIQANPATMALLGAANVPLASPLSEVLNSFSYRALSSRPQWPTVSLSSPRWADYVDQNFDLVRAGTVKLVLECNLARVLSPRGESGGYLLIMRDVTEARKDLAVKNRVTNFLSHKLCTPLVMLRSIPPFLLDRNFDRDSLTAVQRRYLEIVLETCRRLQDTVDDIVAFSCLNRDEMRFEDVAVMDLIAKAKRMLSDEYPAQAEKAIIDPSVTELRAYADIRRLPLAIYHLWENAIKFGASLVRISATMDSDCVCICISADGHGIPPEDHERIFAPFYQVDKDFVGDVDGTGLGLSIAREIIEAHGGAVTIESAQGKGCTVFVRLPLPQNPAQTQTPGQSDQQKAA